MKSWWKLCLLLVAWRAGIGFAHAEPVIPSATGDVEKSLTERTESSDNDGMAVGNILYRSSLALGISRAARHGESDQGIEVRLANGSEQLRQFPGEPMAVARGRIAPCTDGRESGAAVQASSAGERKREASGIGVQRTLSLAGCVVTYCVVAGCGRRVGAGATKLKTTAREGRDA